MNGERFQEIKKEWENKYDWSTYYISARVVKELIATIEASQAIGKIWQEQETDIHKQLAEVQAEVRRLEFWQYMHSDDNETIERLGVQLADLRKQLDASHAVNDVYKNMVKVLELTIELLNTNGE